MDTEKVGLGGCCDQGPDRYPDNESKEEGYYQAPTEPLDFHHPRLPAKENG